MHDDRELLRQFVHDRAEAAFAELVRRHLGLVYGVALRQVAGDAHLAQDVAQTVFLSLARKAPALLECEVLGGWLHACAVNAAANAVRTERRRRAREQEAFAMHETQSPSPADHGGGPITPLIDEALRRLKPAERDALVLRFFENRPFAEIGAILQLNENTARMRVERALERLKTHLERRGVRSTAAALSAALTGAALATPPAGLAATVTGVAVAGASGVGVIAGVWTAVTALTKGQAAALAGLAASGVLAIGVQQRELLSRRAEIAGLHATQTRTATTLPATSAHSATADSPDRANDDRPETRVLRDRIAMLRVRLQRARTEADTLAAAVVPRAPGTSIIEASRSDPPPKPQTQRSPVYPFELQLAGIPGEALVDFVVDETGTVRQAAAAEATHPRFAAVSVAAVRQWTFEPGRLNGAPVSVQVRLPLRFEPRGPAKWF